jgi:hypothetical protein
MFPWWMPFLLERHFNKYRRELSVEELAVIELMRSIFAASLMLVLSIALPVVIVLAVKFHLGSKLYAIACIMPLMIIVGLLSRWISVRSDPQRAAIADKKAAMRLSPHSS